LLCLLGATPAAAHPDPTTDGWSVHLVIREHVVVSLLPFSWPAKGTITGVYGDDAGRRHPGIDIGILRSLKVNAAVPGRVVHAGYVRGFEGYGKLVVERAGRFTILYAHLSTIRVHTGQKLHRGVRIGTAGCTGWCTGTHLHFELREDGTAVDPAPLLPATIPAPEGG
jgi:murein DD-endopeptidase MepM/ murein hydrolase activator NlpD